MDEVIRALDQTLRVLTPSGKLLEVEFSSRGSEQMAMPTADVRE